MNRCGTDGVANSRRDYNKSICAWQQLVNDTNGSLVGGISWTESPEKNRPDDFPSGPRRNVSSCSSRLSFAQFGEGRRGFRPKVGPRRSVGFTNRHRYFRHGRSPDFPEGCSGSTLRYRNPSCLRFGFSAQRHRPLGDQIGAFLLPIGST